MLHNLVIKSATKYSQQDCVVFDPGVDEEPIRKITYSELRQQVTELMFAFKSLNVREQIVGVLLAECPEIPSILIGLLSSSCAFQPISLEGLRYTANALVKVGTSWIVAHEEFLAQLLPLLTQLKGQEVQTAILTKYGLHLFRLEGDLSRTPSKVVQYGLAYCITTSGTTSSPKVVQVPHSCIVPNVFQLRNIFQLTHSDRVLLTSPLTFDPSIIDIFCTLSSGACLVIVPSEVKRRPEILLNVIHQRQAVTVIQATPTLIRSLTPAKLQQTILGPFSSLRVLALGGENFPSGSELGSWLHASNRTTQFYNLYGITEVSCWASCQLVDIRALLATDNAVPIGPPLEKTLIKLVPCRDKDGVAAEDEGDIWIGSEERVCFIDDETEAQIKQCENSAYAEDVERDKTIWRNTGDRGRLMPDGSIVCMGRCDDQVKRHGKRLNLSAVEMVCKELDGVSDCCAILDQSVLMTFIILDSSRDSSIPPISESIDQLRHNSSAGSRVSSTIQKPQHFEGGADSPCPAEGTNWNEMRTRLRTHVEEDLPSHYIPDHFIRIDGYFPLTPHGKLDKKLLLQMGAAEIKANTVKEIRNPWTFALHLWKIHLPDPPATIVYSDNFISLGGDSLAAVRAINSLESACQDSLPEFVDLLINKDFGQFVEKFEKYLELKRTEDQLSLFPNSQNVGMNDSSIQTSQENKHSSADGGRAYEAVKQLSNISENKSGNSASLKHKLIAEEVTGFKVPRLIDQESSLETQSSEKAGHYVMISQADRASTAHAQVIDSPFSLKGSKSMPECSNCGKVHSYQHKLRPKKIMSRGKLWQQHRANISGTQEHFHHMNTESRQAERGCDHNKTIRDGNKLMNCEANFSYVFNKLSPREAEPPMTFTVLWKFDTKKCVDASPLVVEYEDVTLVFIGSHSGQFSAIDVHSGKSMWSVTLPDRIESTACCSLDGAYIIVGCYDNSIYVLEAKTGSLRWKFDTKDTVKCSPVVNASSGHIMCGSHDGHLYCLDLEEKVCKWKCHLGGGSVFSSPTVDASKCVVYAASLAGKVSALCTDTGAMKWTTDLHKPVFSSLCLLGDSVLVGCVDGSLYCLSSVGHIEWTFQTQAPIFSTAIVYGSSVLVGSHDHHLYCLNRNGQLVWKFYASSAVYATAYVSRLLGHEKGEEIPGLSSSDDGSRAFTFKQDDKLKPENYFSKEGNAYSTEMKQCNTNSVLHHSESLPEQILDPWKIIMQPHHPTDIHDVKQSVSASKNSIGSNDVEKSSPWNTCPSPEDSGNTEHTGGTHHETVTRQQNMDSSTICKDKIPSKQQKTDLVDLDESLCSECGGSGAQHASVSNHELGSVELSQCFHHASVLPASVVVTPSTDGNLYILDLVCGKLLAHVELPGEVFSSPVIVEDFVITGCRDNFVYCFQIT